MSDTEARPRSDIHAALGQVRAGLRRLALPRALHRACTEELKRAERLSREEALGAVWNLHLETTALADLLKAAYESGIAAERAEAEAHPYGEAWLSRLRRELAGLDGTRRWARWMDGWSDALGACEWQAARAVVAMAAASGPPSRPDHAVVDDLAALAGALEQERWEDALRLVDCVSGRPEVTAVTAVRLLVLKARLCLYRLGNPDAAMVAAETAVERAASSGRSSRDLARAVLVEALTEVGSIDEAQSRVADVLEERVGVPDVLIAAGRLAEAEGHYRAAEDFYDAAVLRFGGEATRFRLLAPRPPTFLRRAALQVQVEEPDRALELLEQALEAARSQSGGARPELLVDQARLLERTGRAEEAAAAYHAAGERSTATGVPGALACYAQAHRLAPEHRQYGWSYAEALWMEAQTAPGGPDRQQLERARALLEDAVRGVVTEPPEAWVLVTAAMVTSLLGEPLDALVLVERSVLLDPDYARGYAFLALLLREQGYVEDARLAAETGYAKNAMDPFVVCQHAQALLEAGAGHDALKLLDDQLAPAPADSDVVVAKVNAELWAGEPTRALACLESEETPDRDSPRMRFLRAVCCAALDRTGEERRVYEQLLTEEALVQAPNLTAWAMYRTGRLAEAATVQEEIVQRIGWSSSTALDLGQTLTVIGGADGVQRGQEVLLRAIETVTSVSDLLQLETQELRLAERSVRGAPHEADASRVLAAARDAARNRIDVLRRTRLAPGSLPAELAHARTAVHHGEREDAIAAYLGLLEVGTVPEVVLRLRSLAEEETTAGDEELLHGRLAGAEQRWRVAQRLLDRTGDPANARPDVRLRLALADVETGPGLQPATLDVLADCQASHLVDVLPRFTRDVPTLHAHLAGLEAARRSRPMPWAGELQRLRQAAYTRVLGLGKDAVRDDSSARFIGAVDIRLGRALGHLKAEDQLTPGLAELRSRMLKDTGVLIPGVRVVVDASLAPHTARLYVYGRHVTDHLDPEPDGASLGRLLTTFEEMLSHNLFRWLSVDDLYLWCMGWNEEPEDQDGPVELLPTTPAGKLQLTRLLRMLLREGLSIADRRAILGAFAATRFEEPTDTRALFEGLRQRLLTPDATDHLVALPQELEDRVAAGLAGSASVWSLPRTEAQALVADLRRWAASVGSGERFVTVRDGRVRSYVWRLLAAERPRVHVLVAGEGS